MDDRAFRISLSHVYAMAEPPTGDKPELDVRSLAENALKSYYPTYLHSYLRNLSVNEILMYMYFITRQFGETAPQDSLSKVLTPLKMKILNAIGDSALLDKGSLLDKILLYLKENPPESEKDVEDYTQQLLNKIKINIRRTGPKIERIITQY